MPQKSYLIVIDIFLEYLRLSHKIRFLS